MVFRFSQFEVKQEWSGLTVCSPTRTVVAVSSRESDRSESGIDASASRHGDVQNEENGQLIWKRVLVSKSSLKELKVGPHEDDQLILLA